MSDFINKVKDDVVKKNNVKPKKKDDVKSTRINFDRLTREDLDELKIFFNLGSRNAVIRHLIKLAKEKYLK